MNVELAIRIPADLMADLDAMVGAGTYDNRTQAVRVAIADLVAKDRRVRAGDALPPDEGPDGLVESMAEDRLDEANPPIPFPPHG